MSSDAPLTQDNPSPDSLKEEGLDLFRRGDRDQALSVFDQAADAYAREDDAAGEAEMRNNMGVIYRLNRNWEAALKALSKAETGFREAGDDKRRGQVMGNTGDLYASMHNYDDAAGYYSEASEILAGAGEGDLQGEVLRAYSLMRLRQRRWIEAIDLMSLSISVRNHPSFGQRMLRVLLQFARKLLGTR
jgi:tetratricopeptide (TPR) repeat protein